MPIFWIGDVSERMPGNLHDTGREPSVLLQAHLESVAPQHLGVGRRQLVGRAEHGNVAALEATLLAAALIGHALLRVCQQCREPLAGVPGTGFVLGLVCKHHHLERLQRACPRLRLEQIVALAEESGPNGVDEVHERRLRAPVGRQGIDRIRMLSSQRFEQARIRTLKTHDGLLEIAHHQRRHPCLPQLPQECELNGVGVLKLIDDQAVDPRGKRLERLRITLQKVVGQGHHVGVIHESRFALVVTVVNDHLLAGLHERTDVSDGVSQRTRMTDDGARGSDHVVGEGVVALGKRRPSFRLAQIAKRLPQRPIRFQRVALRGTVQIDVIPLQFPAPGRTGGVFGRQVMGECRQQPGHGAVQNFRRRLAVSRLAIARTDPGLGFGHQIAVFLRPADGAQHVHHAQHVIAKHGFSALAGVPIVAIAKGLQIGGEQVRLARTGQGETHQHRLLVFVEQPGRRRPARVEGILGQQPQSKAMDGGDGGLIELECLLDPAVGEQARAHPLAQLRRGRFGECHRHDALGRHLTRRDPVGETLLNVMGLARPRTGRHHTERRNAHSAASPSSGRANSGIKGLFSSA